MIDSLTLDQLRALVAVVETGSFSAAGRKLSRVQSAISTSMTNLESNLGLPIWDRSTKIATLTPEGKAVLAAARRVLAQFDALKQVRDGLVGGLEAQVSLCVDALFPIDALLTLCSEFSTTYPTVDLRLDTQVMSSVSARVIAGSSTLGVVVAAGIAAGLERHHLAPVQMIPVVSPMHPLAQIEGTIDSDLLASSLQIVLCERDVAGVEDQAVFSTRTWRIADLYTKHRMIRAGLGWGNLPQHLAAADLERGDLQSIIPANWYNEEYRLHLFAIHKTNVHLGPAHRWILEKLASLCQLSNE